MAVMMAMMTMVVMSSHILVLEMVGVVVFDVDKPESIIQEYHH